MTASSYRKNSLNGTYASSPRVPRKVSERIDASHTFGLCALLVGAPCHRHFLSAPTTHCCFRCQGRGLPITSFGRLFTKWNADIDARAHFQSRCQAARHRQHKPHRTAVTVRADAHTTENSRHSLHYWYRPREDVAIIGTDPQHALVKGQSSRKNWSIPADFCK